MSLPTVYYSESKGCHIPIVDLEVHHLHNSIIRLQKKVEAGEYIDGALLAALVEEKDRRAVASVSTPQSLSGTVSQMLAAMTDTPTDAQLRAVLLEVQTLEKKIEQMLGIGPVKAAPPAEVPVQIDDDLAADISRITFADSKLSQAVIVNSLRQYGVTTIGELAALSIADFAAIRFSTGEHLFNAQAALTDMGYSFAEESRILVHDGMISPHLNPNVSPIAMFLQAVNRRINVWPTATSHMSWNGKNNYIDQANRLIESVKSRLANAARAHATYALVRQLVLPSYLVTLRTSVPFKAQIQRAADRLKKQVETPTEVGVVESLTA